MSRLIIYDETCSILSLSLISIIHVSLISMEYLTGELRVESAA